jgi:hypothetical protein
MKNKRFKQIDFNYSDKVEDDEIHDYFKLKFEDRELTDYEFLLWVKLFYYMKRKEETSIQEPSPELLEAIRQEYQLPEPTSKPSSPELYEEMRAHEWIKLQDNTGKYLFGPFADTYLRVPSFSINRFQRSLSYTIEHLRRLICNGDINDELLDKTKWITDSIRGLNYFVSQFLLQVYADKANAEIPEDVRKKCLPYSTHIKVCEDILDIIYTLAEAHKYDDLASKGYEKEMIFPVLLPKFIELKGIAGFSCLSSFLLDAMFFSFDYAHALLDIMFFIHLNFHNSLLWAIEFAKTPVNLEVPIEQRGQQEHTTQMKIYLYDSKDRPRVIRVDMPHKGDGGEQYLHFNVKPTFAGEEYDHHVITTELDQIDSTLDSLKEAMYRECPNLFVTNDSGSDDDDAMLHEMHRFLAYEDMATRYVVKEEQEEVLKDYCKITGKQFDSLNAALEHSYFSFYERF